jgi:hypothetical protein
MASSKLSDALKELDEKWLTKIKPRWVAMIRPYAGKEHFFVDGDLNFCDSPASWRYEGGWLDQRILTHGRR